jgi:hypothetical protein
MCLGNDSRSDTVFNEANPLQFQTIMDSITRKTVAVFGATGQQVIPSD